MFFQDIIEDEDVKLDWIFKISLIVDLIRVFPVFYRIVKPAVKPIGADCFHADRKGHRKTE